MHLKRFLDLSAQRLLKQPEEKAAFLEQFDNLLQAEDLAVQAVALRWAMEGLTSKHQSMPAFIQADVFAKIRALKHAWLSPYLIDWLSNRDACDEESLLDWFSELQYADPLEKISVIDFLLKRYLHLKAPENNLIKVLKRLDSPQGEVTERVLHYFPAKTVEQNQRIIHLMGVTGRYRVIKPLIRFVEEYPEYLRSVMKALAKFQYDEVDQFYIHCLDKVYQSNPMVLIEAIKQVRKRRLRKATPLLDELFPLDEVQAPLINQAVNGEIALTMASFGAYAWAREKLISEMILNGVNSKYLKTIDMLNLQEAVPLLKALILAPETPELSGVQHQAFQICQRLLSAAKV